MDNLNAKIGLKKDIEVNKNFNDYMKEKNTLISLVHNK